MTRFARFAAWLTHFHRWAFVKPILASDGTEVADEQKCTTCGKRRTLWHPDGH